MGMSGRTYEKEKLVVEAAESEPEVLVEQMDRMGFARRERKGRVGSWFVARRLALGLCHLSGYGG